jgi:hypothetical protein
VRKHSLGQIEVFHEEFQINAAAVFGDEVFQHGDGVKIAAFVQEQRRFFLRWPFAVASGYFQNPIVTTFIAQSV